MDSVCKPPHGSTFPWCNVWVSTWVYVPMGSVYKHPHGSTFPWYIYKQVYEYANIYLIQSYIIEWHNICVLCIYISVCSLFSPLGVILPVTLAFIYVRKVLFSLPSIKYPYVIPFLFNSLSHITISLCLASLLWVLNYTCTSSFPMIHTLVVFGHPTILGPLTFTLKPNIFSACRY